MDGAKKSNSGLASAAGLLRDHNGAWIVGCTVKIRVTTSFWVGLWGLREGLRLIRVERWDNVIIELDSEAVIKAIEKDKENGEDGDTLIED